ncbi:hypothetical protein FRX31_020556, partial [Thalictrum thalictroides]
YHVIHKKVYEWFDISFDEFGRTYCFSALLEFICHQGLRSSMSMDLKFHLNTDKEIVKKLPTSKLPIICFGNGSPYLQYVSNSSLTGLSIPHLNS